MANDVIINETFNGSFKVIIKHWVNKSKNEYELQEPVVEDGVKWETNIQDSPGKLTFKVHKDMNGGLNFQEGDVVYLRYDNGGGWVDIFAGFIFTKKRSKDKWIEVIAYDQLRYLKNKATYQYVDKKASDVVTKIAKDYKLTLGTIEPTNYVIGSRREDNQSLFDIIHNALDLTLISTTERYVLYDDVGKICLRNAKNMLTDIIINESVAEDLTYTSSIDSDTYNEIELYYDNDKTNKREYYQSLDTVNQNNWGVLRLTEEIQDRSNVKHRALQMLELYNRKTRELKVSKAFGDYRCRAGASVIVMLSLGDIEVSNYMLITQATHTFSKNYYRMDLTLDGFKEIPINHNILYSTANVVPEPVETKPVETKPVETTPESESSAFDNLFQYDKGSGVRKIIINADGYDFKKDVTATLYEFDGVTKDPSKIIRSHSVNIKGGYDQIAVGEKNLALLQLNGVNPLPGRVAYVTKNWVFESAGTEKAHYWCYPSKEYKDGKTYADTGADGVIYLYAEFYTSGSM